MSFVSAFTERNAADSLRQRMSLFYALRLLPGVLLVVCQKLASRDADPCHLFFEETLSGNVAGGPRVEIR